MKIYDQYHYKRLIIKNSLIPQYPKYNELRIPFINFCYMDFDNEEDDNTPKEKIYFIDELNIPFEFYIFLEEYLNNPTVYVRLYPPEIIRKNISDQKNNLRGYMSKSIELYKVIFLIPLCYSKHYRIHFKDKQYITILCYINVIDKELEFSFPDLSERYISLIIEMNDLENNELHFDKIQQYLSDISKSILSDNVEDKITDFYYPQDIAQHSQSFEKCFDVLIRNQKFNL
jgi:hypothetical protein